MFAHIFAAASMVTAGTAACLTGEWVMGCIQEWRRSR